MNRPWQIWLAFSMAVAILIGAVGWLSVKAIESEKAEIAAAQQARLDEVASLALWRMDSFVTPLVAQEAHARFRRTVRWRRTETTVNQRPKAINLQFLIHHRAHRYKVPLISCSILSLI